MLDELKRLPVVTAPIQNRTLRLKRKPPATKKKSRNLIKVYQEPRSAEADASEEVNPISRLVQIQQAKREREPIYALVEEKGAPRRREFVIEVSVGQYKAQGTGPNKKLGGSLVNRLKWKIARVVKALVKVLGSLFLHVNSRKMRLAGIFWRTFETVMNRMRRQAESRFLP